MTTISEARLFQDGMLIFLDYISRRLEKNPDYNPHPIIRALMCAMHDVDKAENGVTEGGVSVDGTKDSVHEAYAVVVQKHQDGIEVKEIRNLNLGKRLPTDAMIMIFRLQIQLDKINGDLVSPEEAVEAMNRVVPGNKFFLLGDRWPEALEEFRRDFISRRIHAPVGDVEMEELVNRFQKIPKDTPWEEYPNDVRAMIGGSVAKKYCQGGGVVITTPLAFKFEKYKVFEMVTHFLIGQFGEYLRSTGQEG